MQTTIYRDHELVARRDSRGWRVWITDTDRKTAPHLHPFDAFAEARAEIDDFLNRGARQPIWSGLGGRRLGRRILPELWRLPGWLRATLTGRAPQA